MWNISYQKFEGGEGRKYDPRWQNIDGQVKMEVKLDRNNYCSGCRRKQDSPFSSVDTVLDCRSESEENQENRRSINTD